MFQPGIGDQISTPSHVLGWYLAWSPVKKTNVFPSNSTEHDLSISAAQKQEMSHQFLYGPGLFQAGPWGRTDLLEIPNVSSRSLWHVFMQLFSHPHSKQLQTLPIVPADVGENAACECPLYLFPNSAGSESDGAVCAQDRVSINSCTFLFDVNVTSVSGL